MGSEWEEAGQQERTFPRFRTALKTNALHCLCHLSKVLPTCCIHLSRISEILGLSTKHHEIFAAVRRQQLGVTCEPRLSTSTLHPGQPSGSLTRFGSSPHPVGLIRVALPEHASWGNLKTPSNFAIHPAPGRVLQAFDILHLFLNKVIARLSVHFLLRQCSKCKACSPSLFWPLLHNAHCFQLASSDPIAGAFPECSVQIRQRNRDTHQ